MSGRFLFLGTLLIVVGASGFTQSPRVPRQPVSNTYILSQSICLTSAPAPVAPLENGCVIQSIPRGSVIEIQLPGGPSVWKESFASRGLEPLFSDPSFYKSPGRIDGTSKIYRFRYRLRSRSKETISFAESPSFLSKPLGRFTYTIQGVPESGR